MNVNEKDEIKSRHDFHKAFTTEDEYEDEDDLDLDKSIIQDLSKTTLITALDSEDEEKDRLETISGYNQLLDELVDIYRLFQFKDMKEVRDIFTSKVMKPTIEKLHKDFDNDFKDVPTNDPIRIRCLELMGYFGIPVLRAEHKDLS